MAIEQALKLLYRGTLSSCNYACDYCPFAKRKDSKAQLAQDKLELEHFVNWCVDYKKPLAILFTPWGEGLIRRHYQEVLINLSHQDHIEKVAIQTNLSAPLKFLEQANKSKIGLWCTYHPTQTTESKFLKQCLWLYENNISFSVGVVGNRADLIKAESLKAKLPSTIYLWVNVNRDEQAFYTAEELQRWQAIDPLMDLNMHLYPSKGKPCLTGDKVLSIQGDGTVQRCHFVKQVLGNLYTDYQSTQSACPNNTCDCHIGYIHLPELELYKIFGEGLLERIPANLINTTLNTTQ